MPVQSFIDRLCHLALSHKSADHGLESFGVGDFDSSMQDFDMHSLAVATH